MPQKIYKTKQRDEILHFLMEHKDECFTAKEISERVTAGEATVFRTLAVLVKENTIRKFQTGGGQSSCYQYTEAEECATHLHLKCEDCGRLIHMDCDFVKELTGHFSRDHRFTVDCGKTVIYGVCEACRAGHGCEKEMEGCCEDAHPAEVH